MEVDMYDYIKVLNYPAPPKPKPAPPAPKKKSAAEIRAAEDKEKYEVREWWSRLDESKKQEIRNVHYWLEPPKPKKEKPKKEKPQKKIIVEEEEVQVYDRDCGESGLMFRVVRKPDWVEIEAVQQLAVAEM
jgi:hypothetical protein